MIAVYTWRYTGTVDSVVANVAVNEVHQRQYAQHYNYYKFIDGEIATDYTVQLIATRTGEQN